jgi:hypothetical protein
MTADHVLLTMKTCPSIVMMSLTSIGLSLLSLEAQAPGRVVSAEAALDRFRAACEHEIKQAVSPEAMTRINNFRGARSLVIARKAPKDFAELKHPEALADASRYDLFGSRVSVTKSKADTWVLTYDFMKGLVVYIDADSGTVLCVAFLPEG